MLRPSPEVYFSFVYIIIMSLIDSEGCNMFWVEAGILGQKSGSNTGDANTSLLKKVQARWHIGL